MKPITSIRIETAELDWSPTGSPGVEAKLLDHQDENPLKSTSLIRLAPGAQMRALPEGCGLEIFVLEGTLNLSNGPLHTHGYARQLPTDPHTPTTKTGCTFFAKCNPFASSDTEPVHNQSDQQPWLPGQGNLRVKPLHNINTEGTALVHWPANERFLPHQHYGAEEILVLSGTFQDEHGSYPTGTWIQSPHLSAHHPFVIEETVILVKTGHLPPSP